MPAGLQVWDENGFLVVDLTTSLTRILGSAFIASGAIGSIVNDGFTTGTPFCCSSLTDTGVPWAALQSYPPRITFAGNVMNYDNSSPSGPHRLIYGVY